MLAKDTEDLYRSKSENDSNATFSKKKFPHFLPSEMEKNLHVDTQNAVVTTLPKISWQASENFCSKWGNDEKLISFPKNLFVKMFVLTCTRNFWQACRNFVAKIRKTLPNCKKVEVTIFWTKFFFHQKRFFSNEECNFDNASKIFI